MLVDRRDLDHPGWRTLGATASRPAGQLTGARATRQEHRRSSRRPQYRCEVADWPEARQLVGVDDRADVRDLTTGDIERHHGDQPLLWVEVERARAAVDLDGA